MTLYRMQTVDASAAPGVLAVAVAYVSGTAGLEGRGERASGLVNVACDKAHDLSWQGPDVYVWPETGGTRGVTSWTVTAVGFIEQEAREAFHAMCAAIDAVAIL